MPAFQTVYTSTQREALAVTYVDRKVRPARRVVDLAAAGSLELDGVTLEPFKTNENTVRDEARKLRNRRAGKVKSEVAAMPPRDAVEALRRRFVNVLDAELEAVENRPRGKRDPERLRQIARALREVAAIPGPTEPRPVKPGQKNPGTQTTNGGTTKGGLAGAILAADARVSTRATGQDSTAAETSPTHGTDGGDSAGTHDVDESAEQGMTDAPGSWASERVSALQG